MHKVGPGTRVTLNFALKLADGQIVDSNFDRDPVEFDMGDGRLLEGFEEALAGMVAGDYATIEMPAEDAFGPRNEDNIQFFSQDQFPEDTELEIGMMLSFADASGAEVPGVVTEIGDERITIDFNHPLAGKDLLFEVQIHKVEPGVVH